MERGKQRRPSSSSSRSTGSLPFRPRKSLSKPNPNPGTTSDSVIAHESKSFNFSPEIDEDHPLNLLPSLVGTCPFMCPEGERIQRERLRDLAVFERLSGNPGKSSPDLAVKKFCRTVSAKNLQLSDVRSLPVLEQTLDYLLNLLDSEAHSFDVVHNFVFDRTRSIRQDLSMQNIVNDRAICLYEKMVKFHIISIHKLQSCDLNPSTSSLQYLNMEQLTKTMKSLYDLYDANRISNSIYENEAEFRSFFVLLHLGSNSLPMGESLFMWFQTVPSYIIKSKEVAFARKLLRFFRVSNYVRFLCTVAAESSFLQYYIIERYINEIRTQALSYINHCGYKLHPYPLMHLSKLLMMKESDVESFCIACGLETSADEVGNKFLPTKQTSFSHSKGLLKSYPLLSLNCIKR